MSAHGDTPERSGGGWIGVDLDGTLVKYNPGPEYIPTKIGKPIKPMLDRIKRWLEAGYEVKIMTARVSTPIEHTELMQVRAAIERWCNKHIGVILPITHEKDYRMIELWDDRAVQVVRNTGVPAANQRSNVDGFLYMDEPEEPCIGDNGAEMIGRHTQ